MKKLLKYRMMRKFAIVMVCMLLVATSASFGSAFARSADSYLLMDEDFSDGSLDQWTIHNGNWSIDTTGDSNQLRNVPYHTGESLIYAGEYSWKNYSVEMDVTFYSILSSGTAASGLIARFTNYQNFYLMRLNQNGNVELLKKVQNQYSVVESVSFNLTEGQTYTLKLTLEDQQLTGYIDGDMIFSIVDSDLDSGKIGFRAYGQSIGINQVLVTANSDPNILKEAIETAEALIAEEYMQFSWNRLQTLLASARALLENSDASPSEINVMTEELLYMIRNLVTKPGELDESIEKVPYKMDTYNQAGWWGPLETYQGEVYMAFNEPSLREGSHHIAVAVRDASGNWNKLQAMNGSGKAEYVNDLGHNQPSIARDGDGDLHMFASMHDNGWRYFRSDFASNTMQNQSGSMPDQTLPITYPVVTSAPNGDVWLIVRTMDNGRRVGKLYRFNNQQKEWTKEADFATEFNRAVYPDDLAVDNEGNVHILFQWAPGSAAAVRHELTYLKYNPSTKTFYRADGTAVEAPVTPTTADVIQPLTYGESYNDTYGVQSAKLVLDDNDQPLVAYRYRSSESPGIFAVKFAQFVGDEWKTETVYKLSETKATIDITQKGSEIRIYYALATGSDRARVAVKTESGWVNTSVASNLPIERLAVQTNDAGIDILYLADVSNEALYYGEIDRIDLSSDRPAAPTDLSIGNVSNGRIELTWNAPEGEEGIAGYHIYRDGAMIGAATTTSYSDMGLETLTTYTYTVTALGLSGLESDHSSELQASTLSNPKLPFYDDFEINGAMEWSVVNGTWHLEEEEDNVLFKQSNVNGEGLAYTGSLMWTNYIVEADVQFYDMLDNAASGLLARYMDNRNYYILRLHRTGALQLYKNVNGTYQLLSSKALEAREGISYSLKLSLNGNQLRAYVDGEEMFSVIDDQFSQGAIGFRSYNQTISLDNVVVKAILDKDALQEAMSRAEMLEQQTSVGSNPGEVSRAAMDALIAAMDVAIRILDDQDIDQEDVNETVSALNAAIALFESSVVKEPGAPIWINGDLNAANIGRTEVTLSWSGANDDIEVTAYRIDRNGVQGTTLTMADLTVTDDVYSYTATGLSPNTSYTFKVEAVDAAGNWSTDGPILTVKTMAAPVAPQPPVNPEPIKPEEPGDIEETDDNGETSAVRIQPLDEQTSQALLDNGTGDGVHVQLVGKVYEVIAHVPEGEDVPLDGVLSEPVTIELPYDASDVDEALLGVYVYNEETGRWDYVGGEIDRANQQIRVEVTRAGNYAVLAYDKIFDDVASDHWVHDALKHLSAKHIVKGISTNEFAPNGQTTRAEFAALLVRTLGLRLAADTHMPFTDVVDVAWYKEEIGIAYATGIISGINDTRFAPNEQISREQMAVMIVRAYEYVQGLQPRSDGRLALFKDGDRVSVWAEDAVNKTIQLGLMQGKGSGQFAPSEGAMRAESAMVIYNLLQLLK